MQTHPSCAPSPIIMQDKYRSLQEIHERPWSQYQQLHCMKSSQIFGIHKLVTYRMLHFEYKLQLKILKTWSTFKATTQLQKHPLNPTQLRGGFLTWRLPSTLQVTVLNHDPLQGCEHYTHVKRHRDLLCFFSNAIV